MFEIRLNEWGNECELCNIICVNNHCRRITSYYGEEVKNIIKIIKMKQILVFNENECYFCISCMSDITNDKNWIRYSIENRFDIDYVMSKVNFKRIKFLSTDIEIISIEKLKAPYIVLKENCVKKIREVDTDINRLKKIKIEQEDLLIKENN